eukprot:gene26220-31675_t
MDNTDTEHVDATSAKLPTPPPVGALQSARPVTVPQSLAPPPVPAAIPRLQYVKREQQSIKGLVSFLRRKCRITAASAGEIVEAFVTKTGVFSEAMLMRSVLSASNSYDPQSFQAVVGDDDATRSIVGAASENSELVVTPVDILEDEEQILRKLAEKWQLDDGDLTDLVDLYVAMLNNVPMLSCVAICLCEHIFLSMKTVRISTITSLWQAAPPLSDPMAVYERQLAGRIDKSVVLQAWSSLIASFQADAAALADQAERLRLANDIADSSVIRISKKYRASEDVWDICEVWELKERPPPIKLSEKAAARIKELIGEKDDVAGVRISVKRRGCNGYSYMMNYAKKDEVVKTKDELVTAHGVNVYVDPKAIFFIVGTEMDFKDDELSSELAECWLLATGHQRVPKGAREGATGCHRVPQVGVPEGPL